MKNKNLATVLIVLLLLILFGAGAFFLSKNKTLTPSSQKTAAKPTQTPAQSAESTLKDLIASKTPVTCTYLTNAGSTKISGTVYVAGGKVRGDFTTTSGSNVIESHMATDAQYVYTWMDNSKQGYKFVLSTLTGTKQTEGQNSQAPDLNQKFNFSCTPWSLDDKMLELPKDVTFTTFSIPTAPTGTTGGTTNNQAACQTCANLPAGAERTACLTQLHCN